MATASTFSTSIVTERRFDHVHKYRWPAAQLNVWILVMIVSSCTLVGIFSTFVQIQHQLLLSIPWYFPFLITVGSLSLIFVGFLLFLIFQRRLLPSIVIIGGFLIFVLWVVGLVVMSMQLWGPSGSVSASCNLAVFNVHPHGESLSTLAWLEQRTICQSWHTAFAFGLVGSIFLFWIMVMAYRVFAEAG